MKNIFYVDEPTFLKISNNRIELKKNPVVDTFLDASNYFILMDCDKLPQNIKVNSIIILWTHHFLKTINYSLLIGNFRDAFIDNLGSRLSFKSTQ